MATSVNSDSGFPAFERQRREPAPTTSHDELFSTTVTLLREWADTSTERTQGGSHEHHLRRHLWSELAERGQQVTVTSPRGTDTPDIVVDDRLGIKVVSSLNQGATGWFHRELHTLGQGYDHLAVFGNDLDGEHVDRWRHLQMSITADDVGLNDIAFVDTIDETTSGGASVGLPVAPETVALLVLTVPLIALGVQIIVEFVLSLETTGSSLLVAVGIVYLVGVSLLAAVLKLL